MSGTKTAGRIAVETSSVSASRLMCTLRARSFTYTTPTTSSSFSPVTGIRENPERSARVSAWRMVLNRSTEIRSVRGTITSRTRVSPSWKTECTIRRSSSSISDSFSARSTSERSSASEAKGPCRKPLPGVRALPRRISSRGIGPMIRASGSSTYAAAVAVFSGCWRPIVRGETPTATYETSTITAMATVSACQVSSKERRQAYVTSTPAAISQPTRTSSATFR